MKIAFLLHPLFFLVFLTITSPNSKSIFENLEFRVYRRARQSQPFAIAGYRDPMTTLLAASAGYWKTTAMRYYLETQFLIIRSIFHRV